MANIIAAHFGDIAHAELRILLANRALTKAGLADHATAHEDVLTANAVTYTLDGVFYSKAAVAQIDLSTLAVLDETGSVKSIVAQAIGATRVYLLALDSAGVVKIVQAADVATTTSSSNVPGCPRGYAPFGAVKIVNASAAAFIFGTTSKTAVGITASYFDVSLAPETL
ncbi:MAG: hypothetical protein WBO35_03775 [Candidatus Saccharimonadales bacterium]